MFLTLTVYCVLIAAISILGGAVINFVSFSHARLQTAISFVAGVMLGVGLLSMLPHAQELLGDISKVVIWVLLGFLTMFFLERFFDFHHHEIPKDKKSNEGIANSSAWGGAALGLVIHSITDGFALAAVMQAEKLSTGTAYPIGFAIFLAIILHKPFASLTITILMAAGGWSGAQRWVVNLLYALTVPLGVALFFAGFQLSGEVNSEFLGYAMAFSCGTFICVAASDLLPEIHFCAHDRLKLSIALLLGVSVAWFMQVYGHEEHHSENETHEHEHEHQH